MKFVKLILIISVVFALGYGVSQATASNSQDAVSIPIQQQASPPCTAQNPCDVRVIALLPDQPIRPGLITGDEIWTWDLTFSSKRFTVPDISSVDVVKETTQGDGSFSNEIDLIIEAEADGLNYNIRKFYRQAFDLRCNMAISCN